MRARFVLAFLALAALPVPAAFADAPLARAIDVAHSNATFTISHVFVGSVTGRVPIASGSVTLAAGALIPTLVEATLAADRLQTDEPDRDGSLRSPDYFDTKAYPTWTFVSTKVTPLTDTTFGVDGVLTMHGVAQPEHLDVTVRGDAEHPLYHAVAHVDRRAFGMKGTVLDPAIGTIADVTLDIALR